MQPSQFINEWAHLSSKERSLHTVFENVSQISFFTSLHFSSRLLMFSVILVKLLVNCLYSILKLVILQNYVVYSLYFVILYYTWSCIHCFSPVNHFKIQLAWQNVVNGNLSEATLSGSTIDVIYQWCYSARLNFR